MKLWYLLDSQRVGLERRKVEALAADEGWFEFERWWFYYGQLAAEGVIVAHGHRYRVRLVFPDQFPEVPAWVEPQEGERWTAHQYRRGTLCLELRPDNWDPDATGADVLRSAYNLLVKENPLGEGDRGTVPSAEAVGEVQSYGWRACPVLISKGCYDRISLGEAVGLTALRWHAGYEVWPIVLHDEGDRQGTRRPPGADLATWRFEIMAAVSDRAAPDGELTRRSVVRAGVLEAETAAALETRDAVFLFAGGNALRAYHLFGDEEVFERDLIVLPDEAGIRSGRTSDAEGKRVAIVGAGSVGSKVAESLVRSGVGKLTLVDGDVLLPANLERHALDWRDVGYRKVHGLERKLCRIAPGVEVSIVEANINWQRSPLTHSLDIGKITDCDVIVDATGDPASGLLLGAVATANGRAFVSVEVFAGGIGGLIATSLPERDPPFAIGRRSFLAWCETEGVVPPDQGPRNYEALASDGPPVIADDAAVSTTAGHASRVILDILDGTPAPIESAWMLLGYRKAWLFDGHGHNFRINVGEKPSPDPTEKDEDSTEFIRQLMQEWSDASDSST